MWNGIHKLDETGGCQGKYGCEESARIFLRHGKERTFYAKYSYLTREVFWDDANFGYFDLGGMIRIENGPIYPYTFRKSLTKGTKYQYSALEQLRKEPGFPRLNTCSAMKNTQYWSRWSKRDLGNLHYRWICQS